LLELHATNAASVQTSKNEFFIMIERF
jgi:hypothetical protein